MSRISLFVVAALVACKGKDKGDDSDSFFPDVDEDGFPSNEDCDDDDAAINPDADELCDNIDNDCDGAVDDDDDDLADGDWFYVDSDSDGFGEDTSGVLACRRPADTVTMGGDCDDESSQISPSSAEICDDIDNDCDDLVDDADDDVIAANEFFEDADGDDYGNADESITACEQPSGYTDRADDCNDDNANAYPGAPEYCHLDVDFNCDGFIGYEDNDGDGFAACEECDDGAKEINPDADEICDDKDVDENCNGYSDIGDPTLTDAVTWYFDGDGDSQGNSYAPEEACAGEHSKGYVDNDDDCDDTNSDSYVGADEICDREDNDCDGTIPANETDDDFDTYTECEGDCDDGNPKAYPSSLTFYEDSDGDGYGTNETIVSGCEVPKGFADNFKDCDDDEEDINPDADEYCDDIDNDCDGTIDNSYALDADTWYLDGDNDTYGLEGSTIEACNEPSGYAEIFGDCDDKVNTINPGADEVCNNGEDDNCDGYEDACELEASSSDLVLLGEDSGDELGIRISAWGDVGDSGGAPDGINDLLIGARGHDVGKDEDMGAVYLVWGPITATGTVDIDSVNGHKLTGEAAGDKFGRSVAMLGDVTDDSRDDIAAGAPSSSDTKTQGGVAYIVSGSTFGTTSDDVGSVFHLRLQPESNYDYLGSGSGSAGDVNDDSEGDVWIGATGDDDGGSGAGAMYLLTGPVDTGSKSATTAQAKILGETGTHTIGNVFAAGDYDGDGFSDVLVGVKKDDESGLDAGAGYLVSGPMTGSVSLGSADAKFTASGGGDAFGSSVSNAGDLNGDGRDDFIIGAPGDDHSGGIGAGTAFVFLGPATMGDLDGGDATSDSIAQLRGESSDYRTGSSVAGGGDFDGDGSNDFMVAAEDWGSSSEGAAYLVLGPVSGTSSVGLDESGAARFIGSTLNNAMGAAMSFTGQIDASHDEALFFATSYDDAGGSDAGAAFLIFDIDGI